MARFFARASFLRSVTMITSINVLMTVLNTFSGLYVARHLSAPDYGEYAYMANIFLLVILFLGFGLTGQVAKDVAENHPQLQERLRHLATLRFITCCGAAVLGLVLWFVLGQVAYLYAGIGGGFAMYADYTVGALSGLRRIKHVSILLITQPLTFLVLALLLPITNVAVVYTLFLASQSASAIVALILTISTPTLRVFPRVGSLQRLEWSTLAAGQIYLAVLLQTAYSVYGVIAPGLFGWYQEAGSISIALTVVTMLPLFTGTMISVVYYPRICSLQAKGQQASLVATGTLTCGLATLVGAGCMGVLLVYGDVVINLLYSSKHADAIPFARIGAALSFFGVIDQVLVWTLVALNRSRQMLLPSIARILVLVATLPFALLHNAHTFAIVAMVAYPVGATVCWVLQLRQAKLIPVLPHVLFALLCLAFSVCLSWGIKAVYPAQTSSGWNVIKLIMSIGIYAVLGLAMFWRRERQQVHLLLQGG